MTYEQKVTTIGLILFGLLALGFWWSLVCAGHRTDLGSMLLIMLPSIAAFFILAGLLAWTFL